MDRAASPDRADSESPVKRARNAVRCWWIPLRERVARNHSVDSQVETCLELKKGIRFRLNGGRVQLLDDDTRSGPGKVSPDFYWEITKDVDSARARSSMAVGSSSVTDRARRYAERMARLMSKRAGRGT